MNNFNQPYLKNKGRFFTPVYLPGEDYSFYVNFDNAVSEVPTGIFWEFWLIKPDGTQVFKIAPSVYFLFLDSGFVTYDIFVPNFVFPRVPDGEYYFQIYNPDTASEILRSNLILCSSSCLLNTTPVKFKHDDRIYGIRYDLLETRTGFTQPFYQKFRLPFNQIGAIDVSSDRESYRESSNGRDLRNSKSFRDIKITLEFYFADDEDFEAVSAILEHNEIYISGNRIINMSQIKVEKPSHVSALSKGTFTVIVDEYNKDYDSLDGYGDFILWGGDGNKELNTFVSGT